MHRRFARSGEFFQIMKFNCTLIQNDALSIQTSRIRAIFDWIERLELHLICKNSSCGLIQPFAIRNDTHASIATPCTHSGANRESGGHAARTVGERLARAILGVLHGNPHVRIRRGRLAPRSEVSRWRSHSPGVRSDTLRRSQRVARESGEHGAFPFQGRLCNGKQQWENTHFGANGREPPDLHSSRLTGDAALPRMSPSNQSSSRSSSSSSSRSSSSSST